MKWGVTGLLTAAILGFIPSPASSQPTVNSVGGDGTVYANRFVFPYVVLAPPACGRYSLDFKTMSGKNAALERQLEKLGKASQDVIVYMKPSHTDELETVSDWLVTYVQQRDRGSHDAQSLCSTTAVGASFSGVLIGYRMGQILGTITIRIGSGRDLYLIFPTYAPPIFMGKPLPSCEDMKVGCTDWPGTLLIDKSLIKVNLATTIDPSGEMHNYVTSIDSVP